MSQEQLERDPNKKLQLQLIDYKNKYLRYDVLPFVFLHIIVFSWFFNIEDDEEHMELVYCQLTIIFSILGHCLVYLMGNWSQRAKKLIQFNKIYGQINSDNLHKASCVFVTFQKKDKSYARQIVDLILEITVEKEEYFCFYFQGKKYVFDQKLEKFIRLKFLKKQLKSKQFYYLENQINMNKFQNNTVEIPIEPFQQLLLEQLMEPFSFFQTFSVSLWMMDENRFFAILTLVMLFFSSCTVVIKRVSTLFMLRELKLKPQYINTFRNGKWNKISSELLKPGDICQIINGSKNEQCEPIKHEDDYIKSIPLNHLIPKNAFKQPKLNKDSHKYVCADFLLLQGSCVVNEALLTGESVPQIKESIAQLKDDEIINVNKQNKNNILYCGTEVVQASGNNEETNKKFLPNACIGYVLQTGFETQKGKLIRTVLYNNEKIHQKDPYYLIVLLIIFAFIASGYVLYQGLDQERDRNKLFLRCILIITTVVPPELPMILSIAVNQSLLYLQRKFIYCTEPFRIPIGGKVRTLAFDKTGTLTEDQLILKGIVDDLRNIQLLKDHTNTNLTCQTILAGCHSLVFADNKLQGDYVETLFFENKNWSYSSLNKTSTSSKYKIDIRILNNYSFKSDLKRMSTLISYKQQGCQEEYKVLTKGAPETIQKYLKNVPEFYEEGYKFYSKQGFRVLALAYRDIQIDNGNFKIERSEVEQNLTFGGFYICESKLKRDTKKQIQKLQKSDFNILMITGDNLLTAINIGLKLELGPNKTQKYMYLDYADNKYSFIDQDDKVYQWDTSQLNVFNEYAKNYMLCITGPILEVINNNLPKTQFVSILTKFKIYARISPQQKEMIVNDYKNDDQYILMCGDGSNDVGALKKANVGVALVGMESKTEDEILEAKRKKKQYLEDLKKERNMRKKMMMQMEQQKKMAQEEENLNFGDACIAAPFTSKNSSSIRCVQIVLRQSICTLVTTISTYKILALNSFIQAYTLTALHLNSLKFSEIQNLIIGITGSVAYYQTSNSKPLKEIYNKPPPSTIFDPYFIISLVVQIALNLYGTKLSVDIGLKYSTEEQKNINHDAEFKPAFLNTAVFLFQLLQQTVIFMFNNGGEPFMEGLKTKKKYLKMMLACIAITFLLTLNIYPDITEKMDCTFEGVPEEANYELLQLFLIITLGSWFLEIGLKSVKYNCFWGWI